MKRMPTSLFAVKAKSVDLNEDVVRYDMLNGGPLPLVITPANDDVSLSDWLRSNGDTIREKGRTHGGVLFRGFGVATPEDFHAVVGKLGHDQLDYNERSSPRSRVSGKIFTSTDHPADQPINFHNELAYSSTWPMDIFFFCHTEPTEGGETPIADSRRVLQALSGPTRDRFRELGVMYMRYLGSGLGLHWKEVFQTDSREEVEEYCRENDMEFEWEGDCLRTRAMRPAIRKHPDTGEEVWFNHGHFFNVHSMEPEVRDQLLSTVERDKIPFNTYFGDGSEIPAETVAEVNAAFESARVEFPWQHGDILYLDNMLTAHARNPYKGERRILVAMSRPAH